MPRSHKNHSSSFTKFVARLQHTFSSKNTKSSTVIIPDKSHHHISNRFQLSEILYDPTRSIEYVSEIKEHDNSNSFSSIDSTNLSQDEQYNLSKMNISYEHYSPKKLIKLPNLSNKIQLHSTAIYDINHM